MKKALLFIFAFVFYGAVMAQVCTPDTSLKTPGIYPINGSSNGFEVIMPDAYAGVPYNELVQLRVPLDTVIDTLGFQITAAIVYLQILDFVGMPSTISYQCDTSNCYYGAEDNGCMLFTGTPLLGDVGMHQVDIKVYGVVDAGFLGLLGDTMYFKMDIEVFPPQGIDEFVHSNSIKVSPNPFDDRATLSFEAKQNNDYTLRVIDLTGRTISELNGRTRTGTNEIAIERNNLPAGMYFYSLEIEDAVQTGRFIISQ